MEIFPLFVLLMLCSLAHAELYRDFEKRIYEENKWQVDNSAAQICYIVDGTLEEVKAGDPEHGYTCDTELDAPSADKKDAEDMCKSIFPHYILEADKKGEKTRCKFIIVNRCLPNYFLIYEKCYMVLEKDLPYAKAKEVCSTAQGTKPEAKLAEYTSSNLGLDLLHMDFKDVWVQVPDLNEHFGNDKEEGGAVFIVQNSWRFESKEGVLKMDDLTATHFPLCEYTPIRTLAGVQVVIKAHNSVPGFPKILPLPGGGHTFDTSELCPARDPECKVRVGGAIWGIFVPGKPKFDDGGRPVFGVPTAPKPQGEPGPCPDGWFRYKRKNGLVMCHMMYSQYGKECYEDGAQFTGFESGEEIVAAKDHFHLVGYYRIGGVQPCTQPACYDKPTNPKKALVNGKYQDVPYRYQWTNGMSSNLDLLYDQMATMYLFNPQPNGVVALEADYNNTMRRNIPWEFWAQETQHTFYICGKYADY